MRVIAVFFILFLICTHNNVYSIGLRNQIKNQSITPKKESSMVIDFTKKKGIDNWRITNDGVMGGRSSGRFLVEQDKGTFQGNISLDNNGGFSSVFRIIEPLSKNIETVTIDILGDGLTYQLRMIVNINGYRLAYKHNVNTLVGQREALTFTLANFQASFRGRIITNAPVLKSEDVRQVGFLVTTKVAGEFSLSVFSVSFCL